VIRDNGRALWSKILQSGQLGGELRSAAQMRAGFAGLGACPATSGQLIFRSRAERRHESPEATDGRVVKRVLALTIAMPTPRFDCTPGDAKAAGACSLSRTLLEV